MIIPNPTPGLQSAQSSFAAFIDGLPKTTRLVALHDSDTDGITAGVLWQRTMERLGFTDLTRIMPDRERNAWLPGNRRRVAEAKPERLFVLDLGAQPVQVLEGVPTCFIDHHRPEGIHPADTLISAYQWDPIPTTSLLMYELGSSQVDLADLDWIAATGIIGDLGEKAPFELLENARKKYFAKYLRETAVLLNAARRSGNYQPDVAARVLETHASPREIAESASPDVKLLNEARHEVKLAMDEARKVAPVFSGKVALLRLHSPCQVHPLIAQQWRGRLPKYIVIGANYGYLPGRVNFSVRTNTGESLLDFLRGIELEGDEGNYGHGHDAASGGSLPAERFNRLLEKLGFDQQYWAPVK